MKIRMLQKGYTIVELLVVIMTIGILATLMTASYNGTLNRAHDAVVQADLGAIAGQLEAYRVNPNNPNPNEFPRDVVGLASLGVKAAKNSYQTTINANFIYCTASNYQTFALVAKSKPNNFFMITEKGFKPYALTASDFTAATLCPLLGMVLVSSGMSAPGTWQTWVGNS